MRNLAIQITWDNRDELLAYFNKFHKRNYPLTNDYYLVYSIFENRLRFTKNPTDLDVLSSVAKFIDEHQEIIQPTKVKEVKLGFWERRKRVKELAAMDNKPYCEINPSY